MNNHPVPARAAGVMYELAPKPHYDFRRLKLRNDCVIAKPWGEQEVGGILIPVQAQEQKTKSLVCAVGPGLLKDAEKNEREHMKVKQGDVIYHSKFAGSETDIHGEKFLVMRQEDIYGRFIGIRPIDIELFEDRVLVEWEQGLHEYRGTKLLRSQGPMDRHYTGIVLSTGPEVYDVKVGERVFFDQFCGPERVDHEGKRYAFIHERDVYCVIPLREELEVLSQ